MKRLLQRASLFLLLLPTGLPAMPPIETVFVIVFENLGWDQIKNSPNAPYLNQTVLPRSSYCEAYLARPGLHPSEPNYLWMEAGTNFGIFDNNDPAVNHQNTTNHLVAQLRAAGISWRSYQEDIDGLSVPLVSTNLYAVRHNPFVYFDDVTGTNNPSNPYGIAHNRPYAELAADLANGTVARYNFITPNLCNGGHDACAPAYNSIGQVDTWLARELPKILGSAAFSNNGAIFLTWDESLDDSPVGMVVVSPRGRGNGYHNYITYTHSSMVRTMQQIFGVRPWLADAANAIDLSDLFADFRLTQIRHHPTGSVELTATVIDITKTNVLLASLDLQHWTPIQTNIPTATSYSMIDDTATNHLTRYYKLMQLP